jgi:hypothetical protein
MKALRLGSLAVVAAVLAGCPGEEPAPPPAFEQPTVAPPAETPATMAPAAQRVQFEAIEGVMFTGEVIATPRMDRTDVALSVTQGPPNESLGARILSGTCESPGVVVANLDAVSTNNAGQGQSTTDVGYAPNLILDGNHIVGIYAPGTSPEQDMPMACATLPSQV